MVYDGPGELGEGAGLDASADEVDGGGGAALGCDAGVLGEEVVLYFMQGPVGV